MDYLLKGEDNSTVVLERGTLTIPWTQHLSIEEVLRKLETKNGNMYRELERES